MLETLHISRITYGENKGKLEGRIGVASQSGKIELILTEEQSEAIVGVVSDCLVSYSRDIADQMNVALLEGTETALLIGDGT